MKRTDEKLMRQALTLARKGEGRTRPNPPVGAVIVKKGIVIGKGYHRGAGLPHAEIAALESSKESPRNADMYVTLEPCGHFGRTPPCAHAIAEAGIKRVYYGCPDPNPQTSGKGLEFLTSRGISVVKGPLLKEVRHFNGPYIKWMTEGVPLVTAKWAMTLDGKIATWAFHSKWITSKAARNVAHKLRNRVDGVLVGTGTVIKDDPMLTCRIPGGRNPVRVVLDRRGRIPLRSKIFSTSDKAPVLLYTGSTFPKKKADRIKQMGAEVIRLRRDQTGLSLKALLRDLGKRGFHHLLVEGGGALLGRLFDLSLVDRTAVFVAPVISGGGKALTPVAGRGVKTIRSAFKIQITHREKAGVDMVVYGDVLPKGANPT